MVPFICASARKKWNVKPAKTGADRSTESVRPRIAGAVRNCVRSRSGASPRDEVHLPRPDRRDLGFPCRRQENRSICHVPRQLESVCYSADFRTLSDGCDFGSAQAAPCPADREPREQANAARNRDSWNRTWERTLLHCLLAECILNGCERRAIYEHPVRDNANDRFAARGHGYTRPGYLKGATTPRASASDSKAARCCRPLWHGIRSRRWSRHHVATMRPSRKSFGTSGRGARSQCRIAPSGRNSQWQGRNFSQLSLRVRAPRPVALRPT